MKELNWNDVAARLKALRKQHKLTIERLAEKINVSSSFIGLIEKGESGISLENLYKLSQLYNCSLDYLVSGGDDEAASYVDARFSRITTALHDCDENEIEFFASLATYLHDKISVNTAKTAS